MTTDEAKTRSVTQEMVLGTCSWGSVGAAATALLLLLLALSPCFHRLASHSAQKFNRGLASSDESIMAPWGRQLLGDTGREDPCQVPRNDPATVVDFVRACSY